MQKAWVIVADEFPWMMCVPCVPHVTSLMMKDVAKIPEVAQLIKDETLVVGWFSNHQKPLAILRAKTLQVLQRRKELRKAGGTRFGTNTLVGERLQEVKAPLQQTVVDPEYVAQKYKDLPDEVEVSNCEARTRQNKGGTAKSLLLRRHDSSAPTIGKVYHGFYSLGEHLKSLSMSYKPALVKAHEARWLYGHVNIFAAAYALDPEYISHDTASNPEVTEGLLDTIEKLAILFEVRRLQKLDGRYTVSWKKRMELIAADKSKQATYEHYPKYPDSKDPKVEEFCSKVNLQLALYRGRKGTFARDWVMNSAEKMPAYLWWDQNGSSVPELQAVARMVLAQPGSASICERINSEFAFIKDRRRNLLAHDKANKLVALFHNLRLKRRMNKVAYSEPAVAWTADEEHSGITKFGIKNYS
eukprot:6964033-Prymnesium_polylepis.1